MMRDGTPFCRCFAGKLATISRLPGSYSSGWRLESPRVSRFLQAQDRLRAARAQRRVPDTTPIVPLRSSIEN
jgi:hypothetical protein